MMFTVTADSAKVKTDRMTDCSDCVTVDVSAETSTTVLVLTMSAVTEGAKDIRVSETVMRAASESSELMLTMYCPFKLTVMVEPTIIRTEGELELVYCQQ